MAKKKKKKKLRPKKKSGRSALSASASRKSARHIPKFHKGGKPAVSAVSDAEFQKAFQLHRNGKLKEAEALYQKLLTLQPDHAGALHLQGVIACQTGRLDLSEALIRKAIHLNPGAAVYYSNLGSTLKARGNSEDALACYRQAVMLDSRYADAYYNMGIILGSQGKPDEALACYRKALDIRPDSADTHIAMGNVFQASGRIEEALACYRRALKIQPGYYGYYQMGNALRDQGRLEKALECYQKALKIRPDYVQACNGMGNTLKDMGRMEDAARCYGKAIRIQPDYTKAYVNLANVFNDRGDLERALTYYNRALDIDPDCAWAVAGTARVLMRQGHFDKAHHRIMPRIQAGTDNCDIATAYAQMAEHFGHFREAADLLEKFLDKKPANADYRRHLHFSLGEMHDRLGEYDTAFYHFDQANRLRPGRFDASAHRAFISELISAYGPGFRNRMPRAVNSSELPVFIVGMPRSGTSLVEQILASHPRIFGGGELTGIGDRANKLNILLKTSVPYPQCLGRLTGRVLDAMAQTYLRHLRGLSKDALRITDKMPQNFLHLGLIGLMFPKARVIHCVRDPLDTGLSVYFQNFSGGLSYSFDLGDIGVYYNEYRRLMNHWKQVSDIPMLEVRYEELVEDQEAVSRQMIGFLGLEWDEQCLRFYREKRAVTTASFHQVREPVYRRSVARWKNYEQYITPLMSSIDHSYEPETEKKEKGSR